MNEEQDTETSEQEGWPVPSDDVRRELTRPSLGWAETTGAQPLLLGSAGG